MEYVGYKIIKRELKLNELSRYIKAYKKEIRDLKAGLELYKDTRFKDDYMKVYIYLLKRLERLEEKSYDVLSGRVY